MAETIGENIDILGRKEWVDRVVNIVENLPLTTSGGSFAINGKWGCGKSFVIDMLIKELESKDEYIVIKYNAWENDYYDEPLVAIIASIIEKINEETTCERITKRIGKDILLGIGHVLEEVAGALATKFIGVNPIKVIKKTIKKGKEINQNTKIKTDFDSNVIFKKSINTVQKQLNILTEKFKVVIIVDELDRCLPEYSIKVLERLHHLFADELKLLQIIAIDKSQLEHSIKKIFGEDVDIERYLAKFIKFSIRLTEGKINADVKKRFDRIIKLYNVKEGFKDVDVVRFFKVCLDGVPIRETIQILDRIELIYNLARGGEKWDISLLFFALIHCVNEWFELDLIELPTCEMTDEDEYDDEKFGYDYEEQQINIKMRLRYMFSFLKLNGRDDINVFGKRTFNIYIDVNRIGEVGLLNIVAALIWGMNIDFPIIPLDDNKYDDVKITGNSIDEQLAECESYIEMYKLIEGNVRFSNSNIHAMIHENAKPKN